jgi:hypothetical protein
VPVKKEGEVACDAPGALRAVPERVAQRRTTLEQILNPEPRSPKPRHRRRAQSFPEPALKKPKALWENQLREVAQPQFGFSISDGPPSATSERITRAWVASDLFSGGSCALHTHMYDAPLTGS